MSFLKAEWRKLAIANYLIDKNILTEFVPPGTEIDLWNGTCFVSLVGFMFKNTKLLGIKIPYHIDFEEVNLRFYVKRFENNEWKRGVVFIKEIVPKRALTFVANTVYNENYETMPMSHNWSESEKNREVKYSWGKSQIEHSFKILASRESYEMPLNSETEFITEHYWGYAKVNSIKSNEYEVTHPRWNIYNVRNYEINVDFGKLYGAKFDFLTKLEPHSVMLAEGSEITVENKKTIRTNLNNTNT
ncbi:YqjF family protein [Aquimarina rhabdastrellae]